MDRLIDLHVHTTASDGTLSPSNVVRHARNMGLSAIAITDHDTMDGIPEALIEADNIGLEVLPGIEISVEFQPEIHLLGYFFGNSYENVQDSLLMELKKSRDKRNVKIINKLIESGFDISLEEVEQEAQGHIVGRPHIATLLNKKGYTSSIREAFDKYLTEGAPTYFSKAKLTPKEGIKEISNAGGIPVIAHPLTLGLGFEKLDDLFLSLKNIGLKGVEAYYTDHTIRDTRILIELAKKHELLVTGGSDFHGKVKPEIEIGKGFGNLIITYELLEKLKTQTQRNLT